MWRLTAKMDNDASEEEILPLLVHSRTDKLTNKRRRPCLRWIGTAICLGLTIALWIIIAEKLQDLGKGYHKPFFLTYWIRSFYSILYIVWKLWLVFPWNVSCNQVGEGALTNFRSLAVATGVLALLLFMSSALWCLSLPITSVSANISIYQSASAIVFIISVPLLGERVTLLKITSVCLTIAGVCVVSVFGQSQHHSVQPPSNNSSEFSTTGEQNTPLGFVYVVGSMVLFAIYETGYKKFATKPDDPATVLNGARVLGYIGVHTLLWMWPILLIFHFMGVERFELPTLNMFKLLLLNTFLDVIFNAAYLICIALSSPLFTSVGVMLTVPASVVVDWLVRHYLLPWQAFLGIAIILIGFFCLVFSEYWGSRYHDNHAVDVTHSPCHVQKKTSKWRSVYYSKRRTILYYII